MQAPMVSPLIEEVNSEVPQDDINRFFLTIDYHDPIKSIRSSLWAKGPEYIVYHQAVVNFIGSLEYALNGYTQRRRRKLLFIAIFLTGVLSTILMSYIALPEMEELKLLTLGAIGVYSVLVFVLLCILRRRNAIDEERLRFFIEEYNKHLSKKQTLRFFLIKKYNSSYLEVQIDSDAV